MVCSHLLGYVMRAHYNALQTGMQWGDNRLIVPMAGYVWYKHTMEARGPASINLFIVGPVALPREGLLPNGARDLGAFGG
jgi:hypothetical protein